VVIARAAPPADARRHVSQPLLETLAPLGPVPPETPRVRLGVTAVDRRAAEAWLSDRGLRQGEVVVLQPGAGSPAKAWPGFASLARWLRDTGMPVVALAGPADGFAVEGLIGAGALAEDALARDWPLSRVAALLSLARAAVGNDSGPTHLAAAVGCPTVALFGATDPAVWAPIGSHVRVVASDPREAPWTDVTVDRVAGAIRAFLAGRYLAPGRAPVPSAAESPWP
jgi:ADP-heptose:LPS heptosyltransferase